MPSQRIIQCVGTSEEDMAHLRLLLRVARNELHDTWSWGTESKADLVVVDTRRLIGDTAMRRAQQRGVAVARLIDPDDPKPSGLYLRKPFKRGTFVALLNEAGHGAAGEAGAGSDRWSDEYFDLDLGGVDLSALEADHPGPLNFGSNSSRAEAVDEQVSSGSMPPLNQSAIPIPEQPVGHKEADSAPEAATPAPAPGNAAEAAARIEAAMEVAYGEVAETQIDKDATYPLIYYLEKGVLRGPARIELPGVPALVLDPEERVFLARGLLRTLEPYASEPLRFGDFKRLTHSELEVSRRTASARPYLRLIWMDSFLHSDGFLAKHLDPGGSYRLTDRLDLAGDYPRAFRVGTHMAVSRKLHEIARLSAVGLAEVFDVINAYEAIGYVECTPREGAQRNKT